jgi:hypothetical protein
MKKENKLSKNETLNIDLDVYNEITPAMTINQQMSDISLIAAPTITSTQEALTARQMLQEYEEVIERRENSRGQKISIIGLEDIEHNRDLFATLDDLESEDLGELFEMPAEITEYNQESSSSSSSDESEGVTWYQLVPTTSLIEGTYNYDEKCKQVMMDLNLFLITIFTEKDLHEIVRNKQDLALFFVLCNNIFQLHKSLKLSKPHKALIKSMIQDHPM